MTNMQNKLKPRGLKQASAQHNASDLLKFTIPQGYEGVMSDVDNYLKAARKSIDASLSQANQLVELSRKNLLKQSNVAPMQTNSSQIKADLAVGQSKGEQSSKMALQNDGYELQGSELQLAQKEAGKVMDEQYLRLKQVTDSAEKNMQVMMQKFEQQLNATHMQMETKIAKQQQSANQAAIEKTAQVNQQAQAVEQQSMNKAVDEEKQVMNKAQSEEQQLINKASNKQKQAPPQNGNTSSKQNSSKQKATKQNSQGDSKLSASDKTS